MVNNTSDFIVKNGVIVRENSTFWADVNIKGSLVIDGEHTTLNTQELTAVDNNIQLNVAFDSDGDVPTIVGDDTTANLGGITIRSTDGSKHLYWTTDTSIAVVEDSETLSGFSIQPVLNTWVTTESGFQSTEPTFNLLVADSTRTVNIGTEAPDGIVNFQRNVKVLGNTNLDSDLYVRGNVQIHDTLYVKGSATFDSDVIMRDLVVGGAPAAAAAFVFDMSGASDPYGLNRPTLTGDGTGIIDAGNY